jgi:hypothetical protein
MLARGSQKLLLFRSKVMGLQYARGVGGGYGGINYRLAKVKFEETRNWLKHQAQPGDQIRHAVLAGDLGAWILREGFATRMRNRLARARSPRSTRSTKKDRSRAAADSRGRTSSSKATPAAGGWISALCVFLSCETQE